MGLDVSFVPVGILRLVQGNQIYYYFFMNLFFYCVFYLCWWLLIKSHVFEIIYEISGNCFQMVLHTPHLRILIHQVIFVTVWV